MIVESNLESKCGHREELKTRIPFHSDINKHKQLSMALSNLKSCSSEGLLEHHSHFFCLVSWCWWSTVSFRPRFGWCGLDQALKLCQVRVKSGLISSTKITLNVNP